MYIGELAKNTGATVRAIRLYEQMGLLPNVGRAGKYRVYRPDHLTLIRLIQDAKALGFRLAELREFVDRDAAVAPWECIRQMIADKQQTVTAELATLQARQQALEAYAQQIDVCLADNPGCSLDQRA